jgi:hypothetical protein
VPNQRNKTPAQVRLGYQENASQAKPFFTAVGLVKDAVQVSVKVATGEDALGQGTDSVTGEVAGQVTERILDGKIGKGAAQAVGAVVGKAVGIPLRPQLIDLALAICLASQQLATQTQ